MDMKSDHAMSTARIIAYHAHAGQADIAGEPYKLHVDRVAERLYEKHGAEYAIVGLLHDVLEDSDYYTPAILERQGIPYACVEAVVAMTKIKGESYDDYIARVAGNKMATAAKIEDILHNSELSRLKVIKERDIARAEKYMKALRVLLEASKKW